MISQNEITFKIVDTIRTSRSTTASTENNGAPDDMRNISSFSRHKLFLNVKPPMVPFFVISPSDITITPTTCELDSSSWRFRINSLKI